MIGVTCGSFDYHIHQGHLLFLEICRQLCDILYVAIVADETIAKNKNRTPYFTQDIRGKNLLNTGLVNGLIYMNDNDNFSVLMSCRPDIYILGKDQLNNHWTIESANALANNGVAIISTFEKYSCSTTELLKSVNYI